MQKSDKMIGMQTGSAVTQPGSIVWSKVIEGDWGWLPVLALTSSVGLLLISFTFTRSRTGNTSVEFFFWVGLLVIILPLSYRMLLRRVSRRERIGLVLLFGVALYLVKVLQNPSSFTYPDELNWLFNTNEILRTHHLFSPNSMLTATPFFPGLPAITSALASLSGAAVFPSGLIVIGAARIVLLLGLFLFFERITRSAQIAGIGALLYSANQNFMFWGAQFAYESLALPLMALFFYLLARREGEDEQPIRFGYSLLALITLLSIVITHHLASYALAAFLLLASILYSLYPQFRAGKLNPWWLAIVSISAAAAWLFLVANQTIGYVSPVLARAFSSIVSLLEGSSAGRHLFQSTGGVVAPLGERIIGFTTILLLLGLLPFGLLVIWQKYRTNVLLILLAFSSIAYFPLLLLRLTPAGWETSNRSSEYLFIGIAVVLAIGFVRYIQPRLSKVLNLRNAAVPAALLAVVIAWVFAGGILTGWQRDMRLARPTQVSGGGILLQPPAESAAGWVLAYLGPDHHIAVDSSNARLLLTYGRQIPYFGTVYGVHEMFFANQMGKNEVEILQIIQAEFVFVDTQSTWDEMRGPYFPSPGEKITGSTLGIDAAQKFNGIQGVSRIFDSGNLAIYDVSAVSGVKNAK